jgi:hypothetical protein
MPSLYPKPLPIDFKLHYPKISAPVHKLNYYLKTLYKRLLSIGFFRAIFMWWTNYKITYPPNT